MIIKGNPGPLRDSALLRRAIRDTCRDVHPRLHEIHARGRHEFALFCTFLAVLLVGFIAGLSVARWRYDALEAASRATPVPSAPSVLKSWSEIGADTLEFRPAPRKVETL